LRNLQRNHDDSLLHRIIRHQRQDFTEMTIGNPDTGFWGCVIVIIFLIAAIIGGIDLYLFMAVK